MTHRLTIAILFCFAISFESRSQTVKGSWFGTADVMLDGTHNNYLVELNLKQDDNEVQGIIGYYFRDVYQSFYVRGKFDKKTRRLVILNIPLVYFRSTQRNAAECPMDLDATLISSVSQSTLKGSFRSQEKYKYTCPEIAFSYVLGVDAPETAVSERRGNEMKKLWKPLTEDLVVDVNEAKKNKESKSSPAPTNEKPAPEVKAPVATTTAVAKNDKPTTDIKTQSTSTPPTSKPDSSVASTVQSQSVESTKTATNKAATLQNPAKIGASVIPFEKRKDITMKEIEIESDSVRVSLYDNGDIDGDIVSLYFNKLPLVSNQELNDRGLNLYVTLDSTIEVNEITMFAENLGKIPPNTALMVITDGVNRYEVFMSSSLSQNSTVKLRRKDKR